MRGFTFALFLSILVSSILKFGDCSETTDPSWLEITTLKGDDLELGRLTFKTIVKSEPGIAEFETSSEIGAKKILAFIILVSIVRKDPRFFKNQLALTYREGNEFFMDFMDQSMLQDDDKVSPKIRLTLNNSGKYLQDFLLDQGIFEFILKRGKHSLVDPIVKEVENLAKILCPKKAQRILNFLSLFPSLGSLESEYKDIIYQFFCVEFIDRVGIPLSSVLQLVQTDRDAEMVKKFYAVNFQKIYIGFDILESEVSYREAEIIFFKELVEYMFEYKNINTTSFLRRSHASVLRKFLGPKGSKIVTQLKRKGLFFVIAHYYTDKNVQKILRILDSQFKVFCSSRKIDRSGLFWQSLTTLKSQEEIDELGLILLRYSFNQHSQSPKFFSQIVERDLGLIKKLLAENMETLKQWNYIFGQFISPSFLNPGEEKIILRDFGLCKKEMIYCSIGRAMYKSLFEGCSFKEAFDVVKSSEGILTIFDPNDNDLEKISKMDYFSQVYLYLNSSKDYLHKNAFNYFLQYISFHKSERKSKLLQVCFSYMVSDLKSAPLKFQWSLCKDDYTPEITTKIMTILANAYLGENIKYSDVIFLSNLHSLVLEATITWLQALANCFYRSKIKYSNIGHGVQSIRDVLISLYPDRCDS